MNSIASEHMDRIMALCILVVLASLIVITLQFNPAPLQAAFAEQQSVCACR